MDPRVKPAGDELRCRARSAEPSLLDRQPHPACNAKPSLLDRQPHPACNAEPSLPGMTRQSLVFCEQIFAKQMDPRVKPAGDELRYRARSAEPSLLDRQSHRACSAEPSWPGLTRQSDRTCNAEPSLLDRQSHRACTAAPSLPGLTRQSIVFCEQIFAKQMDPRVKPAGDELRCRARSAEPHCSTGNPTPPVTSSRHCSTGNPTPPVTSNRHCSTAIPPCSQR
jgi:hypothetical protein